VTTGTLWLDLLSLAMAIAIVIGLFISVERNS
jgi:hypothetical protein